MSYEFSSSRSSAAKYFFTVAQSQMNWNGRSVVPCNTLVFSVLFWYVWVMPRVCLPCLALVISEISCLFKFLYSVCPLVGSLCFEFELCVLILPRLMFLPYLGFLFTIKDVFVLICRLRLGPVLENPENNILYGMFTPYQILRINVLKSSSPFAVVCNGVFGELEVSLFHAISLLMMVVINLYLISWQVYVCS